MKTQINREPLKPDKGLRNLCLLVLHVVVLVVSVWVHPPSLSHADRTLPPVTSQPVFSNAYEGTTGEMVLNEVVNVGLWQFERKPAVSDLI